jgi:hypothetical protein
MKLSRILALTLLASLLCVGIADAQTWTSIKSLAAEGVAPMLQLRDGRLLVQGTDNYNFFYILTPDAKGSYENGSWSVGYSLQAGYGPLYYGGSVFLDGKTVIVEGGEYNFGNAVWTNLGSIGTYTPFTGGITWVANNAPTGWNSIGDAESVLMANGQYLQSNCCTAQTALYCGPNCWTASGSVHQSSNDESGYTSLPNHLVLTVDTKTACGSAMGSELYDYNTGVWSCGPTTPVKLYNSSDEELGAAILMYNGKVIQFGGNVVATAIYDPVNNAWTAGPTPPQGLNQADGPAALEPNGKVLAMLSPGLFNTGCHFAEYDPVTNVITLTNDGTQCPADSSYYGHLMILPTGQIASADFANQIFLYNPVPGVVSGVAPTIIPASNVYLGGSKNNILYGIQLNGLSENNAYGDDYQAATNYPLIRFTDSNNNVWYGLTHDDSSHSIAPKTISYTKFDLNPSMPPGTYMMQVVTNGIGSNQVQVHIR